jgi:hypothetical protein
MLGGSTKYSKAQPSRVNIIFYTEIFFHTSRNWLCFYTYAHMYSYECIYYMQIDWFFGHTIFFFKPDFWKYLGAKTIRESKKKEIQINKITIEEYIENRGTYKLYLYHWNKWLQFFPTVSQAQHCGWTAQNIHKKVL